MAWRSASWRTTALVIAKFGHHAATAQQGLYVASLAGFDGRLLKISPHIRILFVVGFDEIPRLFVAQPNLAAQSVCAQAIYDTKINCFGNPPHIRRHLLLWYTKNRCCCRAMRVFVLVKSFVEGRVAR